MDMISVCIPTYNGQKYIRECIDSVLAQTYENYEVVIVDDSSNDETIKIIEEYSSKNEKIRCFYNSNNLGLVLNWNQCIKYARGEWIKFVFQDDVITSNCLETFVEATKAGIPIICCSRDFVFEDVPTKIINQYKDRCFLKEIFPNKKIISPNEIYKTILKYPGKNFIGEPTTIMLHKSVFGEYGLFCKNLVHFCDLEYWLRVACHTGIVSITDVLAYFRIHNQSASTYNMKRFYRSIRIDHVIIFNKFISSNYYLPLQNYANQYYFYNPIITLLSMKARRAKLDACKSRNRKILDEWVSVLKKYPNIEKVTKRPFLNLAIEYLIMKIQLIWRN